MVKSVLYICGDLHNLGDLALLLQNLDVDRSSGKKLFVRRWSVIPDAIVRQVEAAGGEVVFGKSLLQIAKISLKSDVVIGGGQLIRNNVSWPSLISLVMICILARIGGNAVRTRGLGVSKISSRLRKVIYYFIFALSERVNVRDDLSREHALALAPARRITQAADMMFLPTVFRTKFSGRVEPAQDLVIAPCIEKSEGRSIEGAALGVIMAAFSKDIADAHLVFLCHDPRAELDKLAAEQIIESYDVKTAHLGVGYDLEELVSRYRSAKLVVTNRLHSAIFSVLMGCPVLIIDDGTAKIAALAAMFGIPTVRKDDFEGVEVSVEAAMSFDRAARADALARMAALAQLNLSPGTVPAH